jgi:ABC-type transport system involved in multi-copper enzyme maturation permease subunit
MTVLPIISRELRGSARQTFTYSLRLFGAGALLLVCLAFAFERGLEANSGAALFGHLHLTLFCAIWLFVPFLTADCISRERREGTLGLLFLTPLSSSGIVVAKSVAQGLRAFTLWLAVLPVLAVPMLLGGVNWTEALVSMLVNFSAIALALAAGLLASSLSQSWTRVLVYAVALSLGFALVLIAVHGLLVSLLMRSLPTILARTYLRRFELFLGEGFWLAMGWGGAWPQMLRGLGPAAQMRWLLACGGAALFSTVVLLLAIALAAARVRKVWREEPPSVRALWVEQQFCKPMFFLAVFQRWMRRKLERNPIGWLEQRSWSGRLVSWSWLGLVALCGCAAAGDPTVEINWAIERVGVWFLPASMALSAAASFRRERETGVLELLLVSPLKENQLILGRLRGLWAQFLPASALLFAIWFYLAGVLRLYDADEELAGGAFLFWFSSFWCLPIIGLYFSLRCRTALGAFLAALALGLAGPSLATGVLFGLWQIWFDFPIFYGWRFLPNGWAMLAQCLLALLCWRRLYARLKQRSFQLQAAPK